MNLPLLIPFSIVNTIVNTMFYGFPNDFTIVNPIFPGEFHRISYEQITFFKSRA